MQEGGEHADDQDATASLRAHQTEAALDLVQTAIDERHQPLAFRRQVHALGSADQQPHLQVILKRLHLQAHGRGGKVQHFRRAAETAA